MLRKFLLACGAVAFVYYVALDTLAATLYPGYQWSSQAISELSAIGAPTAGIWSWLGPVYSVLAIAFAVGVWQSVGSSRPLRRVAYLLFALAFVGLLWPLGPMHRREVIALGAGTGTDTMHIVLSAITVPLNLLIVGFGAVVLGRAFRWYSIATLAVLLIFGTLTGILSAGIANGHPTPWLGVYERITVFGYMAWVAVFGIMLGHAPAEAEARVQPGHPESALQSRR